HLHCGNPRLFKDVQLTDDVVERVEKSGDIVHQHVHRADRERLCIIEESGCEDVHHDGKYQRPEALQKVFTCCTLEIDQPFRIFDIIIVKFAEFLFDLAFAVETLDDRHDVDRFIDHCIHITVPLPFIVVIVVGIFPVQNHPRNDHRNEDQHYHSGPDIDREYDDGDRPHRQRTHHEQRQDHTEHLKD